MVLDGAVDPTVDEDTQDLYQLKGFDQALKDFLADCLDNQDCPFSGSLASAQVRVTKLLGEIIDRSKAAGVKEIVAVISDKGAESSIALHESFGFKHQGHLAKVGFKFGRWLGTVLMQKSL